MKFMKLIFVDRTDEERLSIPLSEFYDTGKRICEQEFGVQVLHEMPKIHSQKNPYYRHQQKDFYLLLIVDLMGPSIDVLDAAKIKWEHIGRKSGWEFADLKVSDTFITETVSANSLPDDWFRKQARYNYERDNTLRKKSLVEIHAAAFYFARISRDIHQIADTFDVTPWAVRRWAKTFEWHKALDVFDYRGDRNFETQPKRDTARENGELFEKAREAYIAAIRAGEPNHRLATIAGNAVELPRRRIHDWALRYDWRNMKTMKELNFTHWDQDYINVLSDDDYNLLKIAEIELAHRLQDFLVAYDIRPDEYQGERYIHPLDLSPRVFSRGINEKEFCVKFDQHTILRRVRSGHAGMVQIHTSGLRWIKLSDVPRILNRYWDSAYQDKTPEQLQAAHQLVRKQKDYMTMIDSIENKQD